MIARLSFQVNNNGENCVNDDVYMVIRKQLSSATLKYKRIGIIGAMMTIANMAKRRSDFVSAAATNVEEVATTLPPELYKQVR